MTEPTTGAAYPVDWVDAFSATAFGGNGCAVVHGGAGLSDAQCMAFVRETSLVECTFTGPSQVADMRVRYFLASREIPFAGHPTIATAAALRHRGLVTGDTVTLDTGAGSVPVTFGANGIEMTQIAPQFGDAVDAALVAAAVGLSPQDIQGVPQMVSTGLPFCITVLKSRSALERARLDVDALQRLVAALGGQGVDMMEPFLVTLEGATPQGDTFARLLLAPPGPAEDPFTGSATGAMAAYLWHHGLMQADRFVAQQGHAMGRAGQAVVTRLGPPDAMTGIKVAGQAHLLMSGDLFL